MDLGVLLSVELLVDQCFATLSTVLVVGRDGRPTPGTGDLRRSRGLTETGRLPRNQYEADQNRNHCDPAASGCRRDDVAEADRRESAKELRAQPSKNEQWEYGDEVDDRIRVGDFGSPVVRRVDTDDVLPEEDDTGGRVRGSESPKGWPRESRRTTGYITE